MYFSTKPVLHLLFENAILIPQGFVVVSAEYEIYIYVYRCYVVATYVQYIIIIHKT